MSDLPRQRWPHQVFAVAEVPRRIEAGVRRLCLTSPTGGGKSLTICDLIEWALSGGWYAVLYTNRRLLIEQLARVLQNHGIAFGVRAAGHLDQRHLPVQVSSLPTEERRVLRKEQWDIHGAGQRVLAIVDEAHLNKGETARQILGRHVERGDVVLGVTATPIDLGHLYDDLIVAGTMSELRACNALVKAYHYGPDEPDMKRFKANVKTGEYSEADVRKAIMTKCVFGRVWEWYGKLNPEQRPTILFGPGVPESQWFAEQFSERGVRAAHLDGNGVWLDGEYRRCCLDDRQELLEKVRRNEVKVLCNRFVAREGLDLPEVSHLILATVMASLQSYLQSLGRGLRFAEGKDRCTIQDHGGHWHRHGSVNVDRRWELNTSASVIAGLREERLRQKKEPEPIHCPQCGLIRSSGPVCPQCNHEAKKKSRMVIQTDGTLREHVGDIYKPRRVLFRDDTLDKWKGMYHRSHRSKTQMTFRQAEALFFVENHYYPPRDLPLMPTRETDWFLPVCKVPTERLTS